MSSRSKPIKVPKTFIERLDSHIEQIESQLNKKVTRQDIMEIIAKELPDNVFTWQEYMFKKRRRL